jgi:hypothetical protein
MKKIKTNPFSTATRPERRIKITSDLAEALAVQDQAFQEKFGREPSPEDPIFFDPDANQPRFMTEAQMKEIHNEMCDAMLMAGIDPAKVYATRKTGLLPTTDNLKNLPPGGLEEWQDAVREYWSNNQPLD